MSDELISTLIKTLTDSNKTTVEMTAQLSNLTGQLTAFMVSLEQRDRKTDERLAQHNDYIIELQRFQSGLQTKIHTSLWIGGLFWVFVVAWIGGLSSAISSWVHRQ